MTDMVERVEQAIRDNIEATLPDGSEVDFHYAAIAAMVAMREPTEEMIGAAYLPGDSEGMGYVDVYIARETWVAMIDAALSTKEE